MNVTQTFHWKTSVLGAIVFLSFLTSGFGQTPDLLDSLVEMKFINEQGKNELRNRLDRKVDEAENLEVLRFLIDVNYVQSQVAAREDKKYSKKLREVDYKSFKSIYPRIYLDELEFDLSPPLRSLEGDQNRAILQELCTLKLVSEEARPRCLNLIANGQITLEIELYNAVFSEEKYVQRYDELQKREHAFAKDLLELGLIDQASYEKVILECQNYELLGFPEIASYSDKSKVLELDETEKDHVSLYKRSFNEIIQFLPNFETDSISFELVEYPLMLGLIEQYLDIYFNKDSKGYRSQVYFDMRHENKKQNKELQSDQSNFFFNLHFLTGINSSLRALAKPIQVHYVLGFDQDSTTQWNKVSFLTLNENEARMLEKYRSVSKERHNLLFSETDIELGVHELDSAGFFSHLSQFEIDDSIGQLKDKEVKDIGDVLEEFPKTIISLEFLPGKFETPYVDLMQSLISASRRVLIAKDLSDNYSSVKGNNKAIILKAFMEFGNFEYKLKNGKNTIDPDFMWFIQYLTEQKGSWFGEYYQTYKNGSKAGVIFLTGEQKIFLEINYPDFLLTKIKPGV